jgi:hypothetical protein
VQGLLNAEQASTKIAPVSTTAGSGLSDRLTSGGELSATRISARKSRGE